MSEQEEMSITISEVVEETRKYSLSQRRALIEELETDIQNLAHSIANLYKEHKGLFIMYGVQVEVKLSVFNETVYRQVMGCPEVYTQMTEKEGLKEEHND